MSEPADTPAAAPRRSRLAQAGRGLLWGLLALAILFAAGVAALRYGVLLPQARVLIEARTDGLKIGRFGQLKLEGLTGDVWRDVRVRRLTIRDEKGVWLEAVDVHLTWRYLELLRRRFDADLIEARSVRVLRRPTLGPKGKDRGLPVSFQIDRLATRLTTEPAFSRTRGVYDVRMSLDIQRLGGRSGRLKATSVLHPGDYLDVDFAVGARSPLRLVADAEEARGGALAGALGLPADQPFHLKVDARGTTSNGRFTARAASGPVIPLQAEGAWTPAGGLANGRLLLTTSELTAPLAQRLGPELRFALAGRKAGEGVYALDARLVTEALTARAWGPGDLGKRRFDNLRVDAQAPSLSRIVGGLQAGATRLTGVVSGTGADWRFAGQASVADAQAGGYGLARLSGPIEVSRSRDGLALKVRATGAGGRGAGFAAALLGAAPTAAVEAERMANGQILFRRLEVSGRGLKARAEGGRGLLGGLNFKGRAEVSNLAEARLGASGGANIDFQAGQARPGAAWTVRLDARGARFALGMAELDRLLGPTPRVQADAAWQAGRLSVSRATLDGASLDANASGVMDKALALKVDWTANGPFRAGPVEFTGRARGNGTATGPVATPRLELTAALDAIDLPRLPLKDARVSLVFQRQADGSNGSVAVTADSAFGPARARSDFRFPRGGVDLTNLSLDAGGLKADGALSLRRASPSAADLRVELTRGAFIDAGRIAGTARIVDAAGGPRAALNLTGAGVRQANGQVVLTRARLTADGPLTRLPFDLDARGTSGQGPWTLDIQGALDDQPQGYLLTFDGKGTLDKRDLHTVETAQLRFGGPDTAARLRLAGSDGGRLDLDGLLRGEDANIRARVAGMGLNLFNADVDGRVDGTLALQGRGPQLTGTLEARLAKARGRGEPANEGMDGTLRATLADRTLSLDLATSNAQGLRANANLVLPTVASARPFRVAIARQEPMRGRFFAQGEIRPLWDVAIGGERSLAGLVRTEGAIGGTLAAPRATGQVFVDRGRFDDGGTGLSLRDVTVRAAFNETVVNVTEARGVDGRGGQVSGQGQVSLIRDGVSTFRLDLKSFHLIDNEIGDASASGQATINRGADGKVKLTGDLVIDRADMAADPPVPSGVVAMDVKEINRPEDLVASLPPRLQRGDGWALDVKLRAPRRVFLRGRGLDVELSLDAHVGGTTTRPDLSGTARVVRGDYDFAGKRFEFDDRGVVYLSTRLENIRLQLDATRNDPTLTVTVRIRGTAAKPEISLTSSPALPNDEILAQVLFGRSASQLSGVEAAQLASALSSMAGGGGLDVIGNLRTFAGLDRLAFGGDEASGVTVSGGKYVTEDIYLELTGGGREGPSAQVEWRIRKNLSILSRITGQQGYRLAVRWRRDY